jgi:hypothetical protein
MACLEQPEANVHGPRLLRSTLGREGAGLLPTIHLQFDENVQFPAPVGEEVDPSSLGVWIVRWPRNAAGDWECAVSPLSGGESTCSGGRCLDYACFADPLRVGDLRAFASGEAPRLELVADLDRDWVARSVTPSVLELAPGRSLLAASAYEIVLGAGIRDADGAPFENTSASVDGVARLWFATPADTGQVAQLQRIWPPIGAGELDGGWRTIIAQTRASLDSVNRAGSIVVAPGEAVELGPGSSCGLIEREMLQVPPQLNCVRWPLPALPANQWRLGVGRTQGEAAGVLADGAEAPFSVTNSPRSPRAPGFRAAVQGACLQVDATLASSAMVRMTWRDASGGEKVLGGMGQWPGDYAARRRLPRNGEGLVGGGEVRIEWHLGDGQSGEESRLLPSQPLACQLMIAGLLANPIGNERSQEMAIVTALSGCELEGLVLQSNDLAAMTNRMPQLYLAAGRSVVVVGPDFDLSQALAAREWPDTGELGEDLGIVRLPRSLGLNNAAPVLRIVSAAGLIIATATPGVAAAESQWLMQTDPQGCDLASTWKPGEPAFAIVSQTP